MQHWCQHSTLVQGGVAEWLHEYHGKYGALN